MTERDATPATGDDQQLDIRLMEPGDRTLAAMLLADATAEGTEEAAARVIDTYAATEGAAIFLVYLNGLPIAAFILAPARMSVELPLIAVRREMRRRGIGTILARDAVRRAGNRPVVSETPEALLPFFTHVGFKKFGRRTGPGGEVRWRVGWHTPGMRTPAGHAEPAGDS